VKSPLIVRVLGTALVIVCAGGTAAAGSGGSTYSILGLGDIRYAPGARSEGMGYAGMALLNPLDIDGLSPASWSRIDRVRLEGSAFYEGFNSTDGITSRYLARMDFHGALFAVPVSRASGIVVVAGFTPYSDVNFDTYTSSSAASQNVDPITGLHDSLGYQIHQTGSGGMTRGQVGMSWAPLQQFSFGFSFNYLFGTISRLANQITQTTGTTGGTLTFKSSLSGINITAGMVITGLDAISEALRPFSLGFVVTTRTNIHTTELTTYDYSPPPDQTVFLRDTSTETTGRIAIPFSYGFGLGFQPAGRWSFAADFSAQPWAQADFYGSTPYGIRNSYRFGVGAERAGSTELTARSADRLTYRLGFSYSATYVDVNGEKINEWGVTGGLAVPLAGESRLNFALLYGGRGTTAANLVRDRILRLTVALHISDILPWFVQTEEE